MRDLIVIGYDLNGGRILRKLDSPAQADGYLKALEDIRDVVQVNGFVQTRIRLSSITDKQEERDVRSDYSGS